MGTGGLSLGVGPLCGENSGQHLYLPVQGARLSSLNAITIIVRDAPRKKIGLKVPAPIWMFSKKSSFLAGQCNPYVSFKLCEFILINVFAQGRSGKFTNPHPSTRSRVQPRLQVEHQSDTGFRNCYHWSTLVWSITWSVAIAGNLCYFNGTCGTSRWHRLLPCCYEC